MGDKNTIRSFEDLKCWQEARSYRQEIKKLVESFPKHEQFELKSQLLRAARSVTANIAEGYGRYHYKDNARFCRNARGSLYETLDHLIEAVDDGYITQTDLERIRLHFERTKGLINGYINYLIKAANSPSSTIEEPTEHYLSKDSNDSI